MKLHLGFADAGAFLYRDASSTEWYTVVVGVEDSARVRYRSIGSDRFELPEFGRQLVRENPDLILAHAGARHEWTRVPARTSTPDPRASAPARSAVRSLLHQLRDPGGLVGQPE